jgi:hypothetical protein
MPASSQACGIIGAMRFRKLRIAWSVWWGVASMLLCVLWVRSYWRWESVQWGWGTPVHQSVNCFSQNGIVKFAYTDIRGTPEMQLTKWGVRAYPVEGAILISTIRHQFLGFGYFDDRPTYFVPYWFLASLAGILSILPWAAYRFSLRTLLIATTLVAVALGLIVWAGR